MTKKIIRLCYRKVIDASSQKAWDKYVFESSYNEFRMQAQLYNQEKKYNSFAELVQNVAGAEKLHFLVSAAIVGYLRQLESKLPDIQNTLGKHFLKFSNYRFEIINSSLQNKSNHQVAVNFYSEWLIWHDSMNDYMLVSPVDAEETDDGVLTDMVQLQPFLSIYSLKTEEQ